MAFKAEQSLNSWVEMLDALYGGSQNYAKTPYEIHAHLTEVCGIFAKHQFKRLDSHRAASFLPKIFAWSVALLRKIKPDRPNLEEIVLRKFPDCCSYCLQKPCNCWKGEKPSLRNSELRTAYFQKALTTRRSVNDFQFMFREIYSDSWNRGISVTKSTEDPIRGIFIRLIEEVAEVGEAIRFHHLFPDNFENELADVLAWWFALVSMVPDPRNLGSTFLAEDCLWRAYPGQCPDCQMIPCLCRPGPVRQLMSRPMPGENHRYDFLTSTLNQA